ncbi:MAG TPA: 1,4-beta-xylanase [Firmicutes bacterium]|nr:1,4-beta-xylanase [Bacillota bacterium]
MKAKIMRVFLTMLVCLVFVVNVLGQTTITQNQTGTIDGYNYELWKDSGNTSMTLTGGGTFSCSWSNINNALFRIGRKFDSTKTHQQLGNISINYGANYQPNGNSYLCVYGWTKNPLVEYYIVESWGSWRPPGASSMGTITVDGGTYDVYRTTRVNQPSIEGTKTFDQYWSVRTSKRTSGTISVSQHFNAWESRGLRMGNMYEVSLCVEGYQSSGNATVHTNTISIGGGSPPPPPPPDDDNGGGIVQCENMTRGGTYAGRIYSPFSGVALYANGDYCKYTQYFANGTHSFSLRGCSNNSNMARVDLRIGGQHKGTFYYGGSYPAVYTLNNISHGTGNQEIELIVTADNGSWDAYLDYLEIK